MANPYFRFKQFTIFHDRCAMKVTTDACLFGAWVADTVKYENAATGEEGLSSLQRGKVNLLDAGTGSGLLSLMIAQKNPLSIDAVELEEAAAGQAAENVAAASFAHIKVFKANLLHFKPVKPYRFIVSNPPFYEEDLRSPESSKNLAHHSEELKFTGLLSFVQEHLADKGSFFLLMPYKREKEIEQGVKQAGFCLHQKVFVKQSVLHQPFRLMYQLKRTKGTISTGEISIRDENRNYTGPFVELLKDYYLFL